MKFEEYQKLTDMEKLMMAKETLQKNENYYILTTNKETKGNGYASFFTNGESKIRVYEGAPDGSNDHDETYEDFLDKYIYTIVEE